MPSALSGATVRKLISPDTTSTEGRRRHLRFHRPPTRVVVRRVPTLPRTARHEDEQVVVDRHGRLAAGRLRDRRQEEVESRRRLRVRRGTANDNFQYYTLSIFVLINRVIVASAYTDVRARNVFAFERADVAETGAVREQSVACLLRPPARPALRT